MSASKTELVALLNSEAGKILAKEYFNDEEALAQFSKTPFEDFFVGAGDEEVEYPASRPRGYYIKKSIINLLVFVKDNARTALPGKINEIYTLIYDGKSKNYWKNMDTLLQARALTAEPEEKINEKVFMVRIPVEISELI